MNNSPTDGPLTHPFFSNEERKQQEGDPGAWLTDDHVIINESAGSKQDLNKK
jgi:hypothetical protein